MKQGRLTSIDMLRGLVMVIMALDHVRDMLGPLPADLDFAGADAALFFTRWITHLCAPTFMLLAGVSACLYGAKNRSRSEVSYFLLTRGAWLVVVELTLVDFALHFNFERLFPLGFAVIWALGMSMIALAGLIWLRRSAIVGIALAMILGHNLLDAIQPPVESASAIWIVFHIQRLASIGGAPIGIFVYPLIPWIGVMALGYAIGPVFVDANRERPRRLVWTGALLVLSFFVLRFANLYGEPNPWSVHDTLEATLVDFFHTTKYPPSLQFLLMTLGPAFMLLGVFEGAKGHWAHALVIVGRVPFFFYVVHLYVIHSVALGVGLWQGFQIQDIAIMFLFYPPGFGVSLGPVYLFWIAIVLALYPACQWFAGVKARRRDWWLSYL